jgi:hypothetical protein
VKTRSTAKWFELTTVLAWSWWSFTKASTLPSSRIYQPGPLERVFAMPAFSAVSRDDRRGICLVAVSLPLALSRPNPRVSGIMSTPESRRAIANDTIVRTPPIVASTPGASSSSTFIAPPPDTLGDPAKYRNPLPPLDHARCPSLPPTAVRVDDRDAFTCARELVRTGSAFEGRVAVLNLASDERRAGGWLEYLTRTQVRSPCRRRC